MSDYEREYYEYAGFWNDERFNEFNASRVRAVSALIPRGIDSLLDAGCGNGVFTNFFSAEFPSLRLMAADRSLTALRHVVPPKVQGDLRSLPFADREFDCVCSFEVLEHLPKPIYDSARAELARVAARFIIITVPNDQTLEDDMTQCPACRTTFNPDLHMRSFDRPAMTSLFADHGFRCVDVRALGVSQRYAGVDRVQRWIHRQSRLRWRSPICPVCGHTEPLPDLYAQPVRTPQARGGFVRRAIKAAWPKRTHANWLFGSYERVL